MLKLIPSLATILGIVGAGTLAWYYSKTEAERENLDIKANTIAFDLYDKAANELPLVQMKKVVEEVQRFAEV